MQEVYSVSLAKIIEELSLDVLHMPVPAEEVAVIVPRVNRPGLPLAGFYEHYERERIQILGRVEQIYLQGLEESARIASLDALFATKPVAVVVTTELEVPALVLEMAKKHKVPLLRTEEKTSPFVAALIAFLNVQLAPRITGHGVFVEVYGEGVLLLGDSGIGKSETAIELIKRGHRLIADDAVEIKRVSAKSLVGQAPELIRHYIELRGIGLVDVRRIFGMGAVKMTEKVDLVVELEPWQEGKMYDRLGLEDQHKEILGVKVPSIVIPVRPGRNLAVIIEIAAMNNRQKKMGYNSAQEFNRRMLESMGVEVE